MRLGAITIGACLLLAGLIYRAETSSPADPEAVSVSWGGGESSIGNEMVAVPGGSYLIGDAHGHTAPRRTVSIDTFLIDSHEVTNAQFAEFVAATGHVTNAEREGGAWLYVGGREDWEYIPGANWRHPLGPDSSIEDAADHPVVCVSWHDAKAYAEWADKRLPTEEEWEVAARGGISLGTSTSSGDPTSDGSANVWQGTWPKKNELTDGFFYTSPVGAFPANALGVHDMIGNVWEWTADPFHENGQSDLMIARGGSWFCSSNYCSAYRPGFRGKSPASRSFNNVGFRCARDLPDASRPVQTARN